MASTVQEMLFPERVMQIGKLSVASFIDTSTETGGDWFGYGQDRSERNATILIGDVTGHGMPAALITAITNGFFKGIQEAEDGIREMFSAGEIEPGAALDQMAKMLTQGSVLGTHNMLEILNDIILGSARGSLLMTFFASVYESQGNLLRYANAGHNRPFLCRRREEKVDISVLPSDPSGRLGEGKDVKFVENQIQLSKHDLVIWYTDGILECENVKEEMYGKRRMMKVLRNNFDRGPEEICQRLIQDAYSFYADVPRKDDITLVVGKVL